VTASSLLMASNQARWLHQDGEAGI